MLDVLEPLPSIARPIALSIDSPSMRLIFLPLSFIDIAISMNQSSSALGLIVEPVSFVESMVFPDLLAFAVSHAVTELPDVLGSILHDDWALRYKADCVVVVIEVEWAELFRDCPGFFIVEVFGFEVIIEGGVDDDGVLLL